MPDYPFTLLNRLVNTGFIVVTAGLVGSEWRAPSGPTGDFFGPGASQYPYFVDTPNGATQGELQLYPTPDGQTALPPAHSIEPSELLHIGWDVTAQGTASFTFKAYSPYKLAALGGDGPLSFEVAGAYGYGTCKQGYVWREAFAGDHVCVLPETRAQAAADNHAAASRIDANGAYGPQSCVKGYVWREAEPDDLVCVTPATRTQTAEDNAKAASRML